MILFGDYHTHTIFSHGKGEILDNAKVAQSKGLKEIAITDHGFGHKLYGIKRDDLESMREKVNEAQKATGVKIFLGVEANFINRQGDLDINKEDYSKIDLLLAGHHNFVKATTTGDAFAMFYKNMLTSAFKPSKATIDKNTAIYLKALEKNRIDVLTHLNYGMRVNTLEVARAARDVGTFIELNGKRILFTDQEMLDMASEGVKFIINSDAHEPLNVGECNTALNLVRRLEIPQDQIVNVNKLPVFNKGR